MSPGPQQVTSNITLSNILTNHKVVNFTTQADAEQHQILHLLSPLKRHHWYQDAQTERPEGMRNWALETNTLRKMAEHETLEW